MGTITDHLKVNSAFNATFTAASKDEVGPEIFPFGLRQC